MGDSLKIYSFDECILRTYDIPAYMLAIKPAKVGKTYEASAFLVLTGPQMKNGSVHVKNYLRARLVNLSREVMLFRSQGLKEENKSSVSPRS